MAPLHRQTGMATLLISLVLLFATTAMTFSSARTALMEQRVTNNEYWATETQQAAASGLEYALAWLATNSWSPGDPLPAVPNITAGSGNVYTTTLTFNQTGNYIQVTSTAQSTSDTSITATAQQVLYQKTLLNPAGINAPPMVINGCLSGVTGTPDIYPNDNGIAVATSQDASCIDFGHFNTHGGSAQGNAFSGSAWDYLFNMSKDDFKALSAQQEAQGLTNDTTPKRRYYWVTSSSNWHASLGSPSEPVILAFDATAGCPKLNGGPTIYGIVYYETSTACKTQGWGGATVYGSVVHEGSVEKHTANAQMHDWNDSGSSDDDIDVVISSSKLMGTWKDF